MVAATRAWLILAAVVGSAVLAGCRASPWAASLRRGPDTAPAVPGDARVLVREVPWDRVEVTLEELEAEAAASDVHPDDWPAEKKAEAKAKLLKGLQVREDPASVLVLGSSQFRTTEGLRADGDEVLKLARRLGADMIVWSSRYVGKTSTVVQEPSTSYSTATFWPGGTRKGRSPATYTETTTVWIPVLIQADQTAFIAFYLKTAAR
jgi:hypothetical protein